jgi:hypothetical protein
MPVAEVKACSAGRWRELGRYPVAAVTRTVCSGRPVTPVRLPVADLG